MDEIGVCKPAAKIEQLHYLLSPFHSQADREFIKVYPEAANKFGMAYKQCETDLDEKWLPEHERHKVFAQKLQRAESEIFQTLWAQCLRDQIPFIPVHDAIYVKKERYRKKYIKASFDNTLSPFFKIPFKFR